jgi:hypothetical protein
MEHGLKGAVKIICSHPGLTESLTRSFYKLTRSREHLVNAVQTNLVYGVQMTYANKLSDNQDLRISTLCSLWYKNVLF